MSLFTPYFAVAVICIAAAPLMYLLALTGIELTKAFLFDASKYIFVVIGASVLFGERLTRNHLLGMLLITIGIILFNIS
jgi:drug/metabolite transporter (DMT)-like permease